MECLRYFVLDFCKRCALDVARGLPWNWKISSRTCRENWLRPYAGLGGYEEQFSCETFYRNTRTEKENCYRGPFCGVWLNLRCFGPGHRILGKPISVFVGHEPGSREPVVSACYRTLSRDRVRKRACHFRDKILYESLADSSSQTNWNTLHTEKASPREHFLYDSVSEFVHNKLKKQKNPFEITIFLH